MSYVVGLDLSLRCSGLVRVPIDWEGDWGRVHWKLLEPVPVGRADGENARMLRCAWVAAEVVRFSAPLPPNEKYAVGHIVIENYAFRQAHSAHQLGELGGVVRLELLRAGITALDVTAASAARKLLCGAGGTKDKASVQAALKAAGAPEALLASPDACDAMAVANWGLWQLGGTWIGVR